MNALPPGSTLDDFIKQRVSSTNNTAQTPFENVEAEYGNKNLRTDLMWNR